AEILARRTVVPVEQIADGMALEPNKIYVIRPGCTLKLAEGKFQLTEPVEKRGHRHPVDDFFQSLAVEQRERAIAVILSGTGTNGTAGARAVRAAGGICIAQDPATAKFKDMPESLRNSGVADFVLRPEEIPGVLMRYGEHPYARGLEPEQPENEKLTAVLQLLLKTTRQDFTGYKKPTLLRRIRRRMGLKQMTVLADYDRLLARDAAEATALADDLLIHITGFFRDPEVWKALQEKVAAPLAAGRPDGSTVRAWVTACSSGEEAYTLAILLLEAAAAENKHFEIKIFATDIGGRPLNLAREGSYPAAIENEVSPARLARFFEKEDSTYRIRKEVRETVVFAPQNILRDPPFSRLDICTCRNLLIYLEPEVQKRALAVMHFALREGGALLLGKSETVSGLEDLYEPIDKRSRLFRRLPGRAPESLEFPARRPFHEARDGEGADRVMPRAAIVQLIQQALISRYTPPAVVVDRDERIVYFHGSTDRFLDQPRGEPTRDLLAIAKEPLRGFLRHTLQEARAHNQPARSGAFALELHGRNLQLELRIFPLEPRSNPAYFLVTFEEQRELPPPPGNGASSDGAVELEGEILRMREELQNSIQELQANNEEMKASHEETISINEELQSTNEELETSKEELQSLNEELATVNGQLQAKMEELEATTSDLSSLLSSTSIAVVFLDRQFCIRRFTPAVKDLFDLIPADVGRPLSDLARKFSDDSLLPDARKVLATLQPERREIASASGRSYIRSVLPYRAKDDRIDGVVITFVDITERLHAEQALRESEERHRLMLENLKEYIVFMLDPDGRIATWPGPAQLALGYTAEEALGRPLDLILPGAESGQPSGTTELREAREKGSITHEGWRVRKDGSRFWGFGALSAVLDAQGRLRGFVKVLRDNTDRKLAEEALREAKHKAEAANEAKDRFLATVSHELRTPLASIVLWANLIDEDKPVQPEQLGEVMAAIRRGAAEQQELIEDLVDSARIATGKLRLRLGRIDLPEVAAAAATAAELLAREKKIAIQTEIDPAAGVVAADPDRIRQVMTNLLSNAVKFTPANGRVRFQVRRQGGEVEIIVSDTGQGFTEEFRPQLFTPFAQAQASSARRHGGLGIGLGIAREIVVLHGGTIGGESPGPGRGATFRVRLPLPALEGKADGIASHGPSPIPLALAGARILLVEDAADTQRALAAALHEAGAEVEAADAAEKGLEAIARRRPNLVMSDLGLPEVDGLEFIRRLRAAEKAAGIPAVPAVALTAFAGHEVFAQALEAGFNQCLGKPVEPDRLVAALAKLLPGRGP
ncbi:MAG TPA: CheR family methyltransferase, partial [Opitutaceae bacterium]|nr:CheR family methyltransferase [Opitutaceae bacterium]